MIEASGSTTIFAPFLAASSTNLMSFVRLPWTSARSDEHWIAATLTVVVVGVHGVVACARAKVARSAVMTWQTPRFVQSFVSVSLQEIANSRRASTTFPRRSTWH